MSTQACEAYAAPPPASMRDLSVAFLLADSFSKQEVREDEAVALGAIFARTP